MESKNFPVDFKSGFVRGQLNRVKRAVAVHGKKCKPRRNGETVSSKRFSIHSVLFMTCFAQNCTFKVNIVFINEKLLSHEVWSGREILVILREKLTGELTSAKLVH